MVISEKQFAANFQGFWTECLPFLTREIVAELNIAAVALPKRNRGVVKPLRNLTDPSSNDIIAEAAFGLFAASVRRSSGVVELAEEQGLLRKVTDDALHRVLNLHGLGRAHKREVITQDDEIVELAKRMEDYFIFRSEQRPIKVQPRFKGCGILASCYGDLSTPAHLYEVKMVDRNLRSTDIRQVLIYGALAHLAGDYAFNSVCILNPRRGVLYEFGIAPLVERISGRSPGEVFHRMAEFLSSFDLIHEPS